jgi:dihydropteroate synthase
MFLQCGKFQLSLARPLIMGIVNVTPDSFFDGGRLPDAKSAIAHARRLIDEGADIVDVGGESTRPGAVGITVEEERRRVLPVLEQLAGGAVPVSIDTQKSDLMREAIAGGAAMINDVNALQAPGALEAVAASGVAVCLMHRQGTPDNMQKAPNYGDVVADVSAFLRDRVRAVHAAGIAAQRIVVDPGFGFGKTLGHNLELMRRMDEFKSLGAVLLAGVSRKRMLGEITGRAVGDRVHASIAAVMFAVLRGAQIVRVHDVAATRDALAVWNSVMGDA